MRCLVVAAALLVAGCADDGSDGDHAAFCDRLDRLTTNDPFLAFGDRATSADIEVAFDALVERAQELVDVAPAEASAATRDYAGAAEALDDLLADVGYDGAAVDIRAYRAEQLAYVEAAGRLERFLSAEC